MSETRLERQADGQWRVDGELTFASVGALLRAGGGLFEGEGATPVVVDLGAVRRADSAGVSLLIEWLRRARQAGRGVVYRNVPEQMRAIARISNLEPLLHLANGA